MNTYRNSRDEVSTERRASDPAGIHIPFLFDDLFEECRGFMSDEHSAA